VLSKLILFLDGLALLLSGRDVEDFCAVVVTIGAFLSPKTCMLRHRISATASLANAQLILAILAPFRSDLRGR
jgi:hypothetical protein